MADFPSYIIIMYSPFHESGYLPLKINLQNSAIYIAHSVPPSAFPVRVKYVVNQSFALFHFHHLRNKVQNLAKAMNIAKCSLE